MKRNPHWEKKFSIQIPMHAEAKLWHHEILLIFNVLMLRVFNLYIHIKLIMLLDTVNISASFIWNYASQKKKNAPASKKKPKCL